MIGTRPDLGSTKYCSKALPRRGGAAPFTRNGPCRRGVVLVAVVACIATILLISGSVLRLTITARQQIRQDAIRLQAGWLAESGVERAVFQIARSPDYEGEVWTLAEDEMGAGQSARVTIQVRRINTEPERRMVQVVAEFPSDTLPRATRRKQIVCATKSETSQQSRSGK